MTIEELKLLLLNPGILYFIMLLGALSSIAKQVSDGRDNDPDLTYADYLAHWPELLAALGGLSISFVGMVESNTLNVVSAWGIGFASNSLAGKIRSKGRTASLTNKPPSE